MIGSTLSHYIIEAELGRGGMGIVYKAQDTKLDRTVAIKVLPASALSNEEDRARFYREAKAAASLNHPHIAAIYQIDEAVPEGGSTEEKRPFIVMEYIDGQPLSDIIRKGPFLLKDAISISSQVADALKTAHAKGIVHRDVKPANIMLTSENVPKVLDFGLALTNQSTKLTRMGATLGTVAYMSPEQAQGTEVDLRTDIWALGCVLYEMVTGRHPFAGDYEQAVVYSILNQNPEPLTAVRAGVPMSLDWIVSKCLAKSANDRYQSMHELSVDLRTVDINNTTGFSRISTASLPRTALTSAPNRKFTPWLIGLGGIGLGVILGVYLLAKQPKPIDSPIVSFTYNGIPDFRLNNLSQRSIAISDDGIDIAVTTGRKLYVGRTANFEAAKVVYENPSSDLITPIAEPNGNRFGFLSSLTGDLNIISNAGGLPTKLRGEHSSSSGHSWGLDGNLYGSFGMDGIYRIPSSGGQPSKVVPIKDEGVTYWGTPILLPGNRFLVYAKAAGGKGWQEASLMSWDLEKSTETTLFEGGNDPKFIAPDILVFSQRGQLTASKIDISDPKKISQAVPVLDDLVKNTASIAQYDVSLGGHLAYIKGSRDESGWNLAFHSSGNSPSMDVLETESQVYYSPAMAPNGRYVAVDFERASNRSLGVYDTRSRNMTPLSTSGNVWTPIWDPTSQKVAFTLAIDGVTGIAVRSIDLSDEINYLYKSVLWSGPDSWSPDGKLILITEIRPDSLTRQDLLLLDVEKGTTTPLLESDWVEEDGRFSPDGKWVSYTSNRSGKSEIWLTTATPGGPNYPISKGGGTKSRWMPGGGSVVYIYDESFYEVPISFEDVPEMGTPVKIFEGHNYYHYDTAEFGEYDIHPDGRLLMFDRDTYGDVQTEIKIVINWGQRVRKLLEQ